MSPLATRLGFALDRAAAAGDVGAWLTVAGLLYDASDRAGDAEALAPLRAEIRARAAQLRGGFRSRAGRLWAGQELADLLGRLLLDELAVGDLQPDVFARIEELKARTLFDACVDPGFGRSARTFGGVAADAEADLVRFAPPDPDSGSTIDEELRLASMLPIGGDDAAQQQQAVARIEAAFAEQGGDPTEPAPVASLEDVLAALAPDEALIEYAIASTPLHPAAQVWACLLTAGHARLLRLRVDDDDVPGAGFIGRISVDGRAPVDVSPVGSEVVKARTAIRDGRDAEAEGALEGLGRDLVAPLLETGLLDHVRRLIIVPQGVLHYVPFLALPSRAGHRMVDDFAITLAPSASVWLWMLRRDRRPAASIIALGNPDLSYRPDLKPLPEAEVELTKIAAAMPSMGAAMYVGAAATEDAIAGGAPGAGVVHLASHGDFPEEDALDMQRILLAPGLHSDGPLHAEELRLLDLRSAHLVTLSICNGGLYRFGPGDEPYGLVPAALVAGAGNVIGTLWPIDDKIGRLLVSRLYRRLLDDGPAEALRAASAELREDGARIGEWASFVCIGAGRPFASTAAPTGSGSGLTDA